MSLTDRVQLAANVVIAERFRLNHPLARGGMGSVWHATHLGLDIPCAVKFIEGEGSQLPAAHARFEREAKAAAQLRSPYVVQILDHGVWRGTPYIAMELLEGEDLGKRLERVGRLSPHETLRIVTHICRALGKAHNAGIVHRDLKPENVFLVRDDDREMAKVLDFGIAKASGMALDGGSNTKTGTLLGTPYYMSPEQAQGAKAIDHRSDLWSLAVIVFQGLVGRLPFESDALGALLMKIMVSPVPVPSQVVSDLPEAFDHWWLKASQRDPAQRYQSAKELLDELLVAFGYAETVETMMAGARALIRSDRIADPPRPAAVLALDSEKLAVTKGEMSHTLARAPAGRPRRALLLGGAAALAVVGAAGLGVVVKNTSGAAAPAPMLAVSVPVSARPEAKTRLAGAASYEKDQGPQPARSSPFPAVPEPADSGATLPSAAAKVANHPLSHAALPVAPPSASAASGTKKPGIDFGF